MAEIDALAGRIVGAGMGTTKLLRARPGLECRLVDPGGVRGVERVVLALGAFQEMKLDEARHAAEIGFRPSSLSSTRTAASCSRSSSAATRLVRCVRTSLCGSGSLRIARPRRPRSFLCLSGDQACEAFPVFGT